MRRHLAVPLLGALLCLPSAGATLPELFMKAKQQFKLGNYAQVLATVETLDAESGKPGREGT
jgi:hypothetical protein